MAGDALGRDNAVAKRPATSASQPDRAKAASDSASAEELEQESVKAFLAGVGTRVRAVRNHHSLSRRELSERCGVSQRYLVQLEHGEGNVSITILRKIAQAFDMPAEWFLVEDDWAMQSLTMARRLHRANAAERRQVQELLDAAEREPGRARRVALVGLRGAGKSTLGRLAADHLGVQFVELNAVIEKQTGMAASETIALYGQDGYRILEKQALDHVIATTDSVLLAVAGGIVTAEQTYLRLLDSFHTVWLKATPDEHMQRVRAQGDERPMSGYPQAMQALEEILTSRQPAYSRAAKTLDTSGTTERQSLQHLLNLIAEERWFESRDPT